MNQTILEVPHPKLRTKSTPIQDFYSPQAQTQFQALSTALTQANDPEGVGLAFPQLGFNIRGFATYLEKRLKLYLNPEILDRDDKLTLGGTKDRPTLEGCLSIPWLYGPVWRSKKIKIRALDIHGVPFSKTLSSFPARVFLHEYDHLEGILFTDYTKKQQLPLYLLDQQNGSFQTITDPLTLIRW